MNRLPPKNSGALRVLLASASSGSDGGGELYLVGLAEGLKQLGHEVDVLLSSHPRMDKLAELLAPWAELHRERYKNTYDRPLRAIGAVMDRPQIRRMANRFRELSPEVIHINKQNLEDGLDLVAAASLSGLPFVTTIHITRSPAALSARGGRIRERIARSALRRSSAPCLTIAHGCATELRSWLGDARRQAPIHCVLNGVSEARRGDRDAVRNEWNCRPGDLVLGCLARIEDQKNPLFLVELLSRLPKFIRLVWIGDGTLRDEMLGAADRLGVGQRLHIDGWRSDARSRLAGFDVFVLPSRYEGFPFAILEAMAAGLPCIVSDVDGNREAIIDGECGLLCRAGDREQWLSRITGLIANDPERNKLGQAARQRYLECFSLEAMARGTQEVYRAVIAGAAS